MRALTPTQALFNPFFQIVDVREDINEKGEKTGKMLLHILLFVDKVSIALYINNKYDDGERALLPSLKKKKKNNNNNMNSHKIRFLHTRTPSLLADGPVRDGASAYHARRETRLPRGRVGGGAEHNVE